MKKIKQIIKEIKERNRSFDDFDFAEWDRDLSEEV